MLQVTKQFDYAMQLVLALQNLKKGELLSLRKFSKDENISFLFLQRIVRKLRLAGLVEAVKGAQGGYYLTVDPKKLKLNDLVEAVEGESAVSSCLRTKKNFACSRAGKCSARVVFSGINDYLQKYLNNHYLTDYVHTGITVKTRE